MVFAAVFSNLAGSYREDGAKLFCAACNRGTRGNTEVVTKEILLRCKGGFARGWLHTRKGCLEMLRDLCP